MFKETKHVKFFKKWIFSKPWYSHGISIVPFWDSPFYLLTDKFFKDFLKHFKSFSKYFHNNDEYLCCIIAIIYYNSAEVALFTCFTNWVFLKISLNSQKRALSDNYRELATTLIKRLWDRCFSVNFAKFWNFFL